MQAINQVFLVFLVTLRALSWDDPKPAAIKVQLRHESDRANVSVVQGHTLISLNSSRGIGTAILVKQDPADEWPDHVEMVVDLRGLEGLTLRTKAITLIGSATDDAPNQARFTRRSAEGQDEPIESDSPYWPNLTAMSIEAAGLPHASVQPLRRFRFRLPSAMLKQNPETVTVEWIDFYRN